MLSNLARRLAPLTCVLVLLVAAGSAGAATTFTPNRFDDPFILADACTPPAPPSGCSLRGAIETAQTGDTVQLAAGTYKLERGSLRLPRRITIVGAGPAATTIRQTVFDRVIDIENSAGLTMRGVTITGGHLIGQAGSNGSNPGDDGEAGEGVYGAGIAAGGTVSLTDVVITGNQAFGGDGGDGAGGTSGAGGEGGWGGYAEGAGISAGNSLTLVRVTISGNMARAGDGGAGGNGGPNTPGGAGGPSGYATGVGVDMASKSSLLMVDSTVSDNHGSSGRGGRGGLGGTITGEGGAGGAGEPSDGGGLFSNAVVKLTNVTFSGNSMSGATGGDGGAARSASSPTVGGAGGLGWGGAGGAIALMNGATGQFASVTISGNEAGAPTPGNGGAGSDGGAGGASGGKIAPDGGNVFVYGLSKSSKASLTIRDTIIAAGTAPGGKGDCEVRGEGVLLSAGHNLEDGHACIAAPQAGDLLDTPASLAPLADNGGPTQTIALLTGSAAIGAGEPGCLDAAGKPLAADQRGLPRLSPCDIGAFQVQPVPPESTSGPGPGQASQDPPVSRPRASAAPVLSRLALAPAKVRTGKKATIKFELSAAARVSFTLARSGPGVVGGGRCVARSPRHAPGEACPRWRKVAGGPAAAAARAGANSIAWTPRRLAPGRYRLTATPAGGTAVARAFVALSGASRGKR